MKKWSSQWTQFMQLRKEAWKKKNQDFRTLKCAGSWWKNLAPWKLSYCSFSFFFIFLLDQHESVIESVADFYPPPPPSNSCFCFLLLFKIEKRSGGSLGLSSEEGESTIHFWRIFYKLGIKKVKMENTARETIETDSTRKRL